MKSELRSSAVALLAVAAFGGGVCRAEVTLLTQARSAEATSWDLSSILDPVRYDEEWVATDFEPASVMLAPFGGMGSANHTSTLTPTVISLSGSARGVRGFQAYHGRGEVTVEIGFRVDVATPYHLAGLWEITPFTGEADFSLIGPGLEWRTGKSSAAGVFDGEFDVGGVLAPGDYTLSAHILGINGGLLIPTGEALFDMTLAVPGPGGACMGLAGALMAVRRRRR